MDSWIHWIWITFFVVLIVLHYVYPVRLREGMESSSSSSCEQVSSQKNAGTIAYLQQAVDNLQKSMNTIQSKDANQEASIATLQDKVNSMNTQLDKDTKQSQQNTTSLKQISAELQDRMKSHQQQMAQVKNN